MLARSFSRTKNFNPRAPRGARLARVTMEPAERLISIHVPREGHDFKIIGIASKDINFNPRAPRGARHYAREWANRMFLISIHVPREGHDHCHIQRAYQQAKFQSTCPARGTTPLTRVVYPVAEFQSTCPARGTTHLYTQPVQKDEHFNPRAPRGARHYARDWANRMFLISIHVPREGHDQISLLLLVMMLAFQSTCPARGTTDKRLIVVEHFGISIHVPREGHDSLYLISSPAASLFQSTCPARGTTLYKISIIISRMHFNPRAPRGARLTLANGPIGCF